MTAASKPDFSKEDLKGTFVEISPGVWVSGFLHAPGGNSGLPVNNRIFAFRLTLKESLGGVAKGKDCLFIFGAHANPQSIKDLEKETGLKAVALLNNGGGHHIALKPYYEQFPDMSIWITPTRVPTTINGTELRQQFKDRWELADNSTHPHHIYQLEKYFGDQVDCVLFNQLMAYPDKKSAEVGNYKNSEDKPTKVGVWEFITKRASLFKMADTRNDDTVFYHKNSKLIITGHHWEFAYIPPSGYELPKELKGEGVFYGFLMPKMFFSPGRYTTSMASIIPRLADCKIHAEQWQEVMKWDFEYSCSHHDGLGVCGPTGNQEIMNGDGGLKGFMTRELTKTGELTGEADPGSWFPWRSANTIYKLQQSEKKFIKMYGPPPPPALGGPGYDEVGQKK